MKNINRCSRFQLSVLAIVGLFYSLQASALDYVTGYTITDLGNFGGRSSFAYDISNNGEIVGTAQDSNGHYRAFIYSNGVLTDISSGSINSAVRINDNGQVIVGSSNPSTSGFYGPFGGSAIYSNGVTTSLGFGAFDINNSGQIVGASGGGAGQAIIYNNGTVTNLGTFGGPWSRPFSINNNGQVVGWADTNGNNEYHAFLYSNGVMTDLGTFGGLYSEAIAINDLGQIVGLADLPIDPNWPNDRSQQAFLYSNGGGFSSLDIYWPKAINNTGQIVGQNAGVAAIIRDGMTLNLGAITVGAYEGGWGLADATAINELGQIVGWGWLRGSGWHGYLLTPTDTLMPVDGPFHLPTPIPAAFWLFGSGLLGLIGISRRKAV